MVTFPGNVQLSSLGLGTWRMGEDAARRPSEVAARIGAPSEYGSYMTHREAGQLRYFGGDLSRYEMVYAGSGRLIFSTRSSFGPGRYLTWIVHSLQ